MDNNSPKLYKRGSEDVELGKFLSATNDANFEDYVSKIYSYRGKKLSDEDREQLRELNKYVREGIRNDTITFDSDNVLFIDANGKFSNSDGIDYGGLVAGFYHDRLSRLSAYTPPKDPSKLDYKDSASLSKALTRAIFGSDTGDINNFLELDPLDSTTNTRAVDKRLAYLAKAILSVQTNFDSLFTNYSNEEYSNTKNHLQKAYDAIADGKIDPEDYLILGKAFPGFNFRSLLSTEGVKEQQEQRPATPNPAARLMVDWLTSKYPKPSNMVGTKSLKCPENIKYSEETSKLLKSAIKDTSTEELQKMLVDVVANGADLNYSKMIRTKFPKNPQLLTTVIMTEILNRLDLLGELDMFDGEHLNLRAIPFLFNKNANTVFVWDSENLSLRDYHILDVPLYKYKLMKGYEQFGETFDPSTDSAFINYDKQGGVLSFQPGGNFRLRGYTTNPLSKDWDTYYDWDKIKTSLETGDWNTKNLSASDIAGALNNLPLADFNSATAKRGYTNYNTAFNATGLNHFFGYDLTKSDWLGEATWNRNKMVDYIKENGLTVGNDKITHNGTLFVVNPISTNGLTATSLSSSLFAPAKLNLQGPKSISEVLNNAIKLPELNIDRPNPSVLQTLRDPLSGVQYLNNLEARKIDFKPDPLIGELKGKDEVTGSGATPQRGEERPINLGLSTPKNKGKMTANILDTIRLFGHLDYGKKIEKAILKGMLPFLGLAWESTSPITGDYSALQYYNSLAANLKSYDDISADLNTNIARWLDASKMEELYKEKGFLADNTARRLSEKEALSRIEGNIKRKNDWFNANNKSNIDNNYYRAQAHASRLKAGSTSKDNYLSELSTRLRTEGKEKTDFGQAYALKAQEQNIQERYDERTLQVKAKMRKWISENGGTAIADVTQMPGYETEIKPVLELAAKYKYWETLEAQGIIYGNPITNPYKDKDFYKELEKVISGGILPSNRNGGILFPIFRRLK